MSILQGVAFVVAIGFIASYWQDYNVYLDWVRVEPSIAPRPPSWKLLVALAATTVGIFT